MRYVDIYNAFERRFNPDNKNLICTQPTEIIKNINIDYGKEDFNYTLYMDNDLRIKIYINLSDKPGKLVEFTDYDTFDICTEFKCAFININNKKKGISFLYRKPLYENTFTNNIYIYGNNHSKIDCSPASLFYTFIEKEFDLSYHELKGNKYLNVMSNKIYNICHNNSEMVNLYFDEFKILQIVNKSITEVNAEYDNK